VGLYRSARFIALSPLLWDRKGLYPSRLVTWHFLDPTIGIVLDISAMWVSPGILQGLMVRAYTGGARLPRISSSRAWKRATPSTSAAPRAALFS